MKRFSMIFIIFSAMILSGLFELKADAAGDLVREGNRLYHEEKYIEAEVSYRKALELSPTPLTSFNLGDALYKQGKFEEAEKLFQTLSDQGADKTDLADAYHNLGNSYLQSKKYKEGLEAFKKSVLNNPDDPDAKYNYEYARRLLQQQQEQQKKDDKNKDKKDQDKKDDQKQDQDKKDQDKKDDEKKDGDKKNQQQDQGKEDKDKQEKSQKPQEQKISKEDAERMLKALQKEEQKLQKKLKKKQKSVKTKIEKKW